jgi:hypothetical protein
MTATSPQFNPPSPRDLVTTQIANAASLSDSVDLKGHSLIAIQMPADWTAADITFQTSFDGTTYQNLYDASGNEYTVTTSDDRNVLIPAADFIAFRYLKLRSGTAVSPINQGGTRTVTLAIAPFFSGA